MVSLRKSFWKVISSLTWFRLDPSIPTRPVKPSPNAARARTKVSFQCYIAPATSVAVDMDGVTSKSSTVFGAIALFMGLLGTINRFPVENTQEIVLRVLFGGATDAERPQIQAECNNFFRLQKCAQSMDYRPTSRIPVRCERTKLSRSSNRGVFRT